MPSPSNLLASSSTSFFKRCSLTRLCQYNVVESVSARKYSVNNSVYKRKQESLGHTHRESTKYSKISLRTISNLKYGISGKDDAMNEDNSKSFASNGSKDKLDDESEIRQDIQKLIDHSDMDKDVNTTLANLLAIRKLENISDGCDEPGDLKIYDPSIDGHKFGLPELPLPKDGNLKYRDDPIVQQVTNLLMRDGKKSVAQRNMSIILNALRTARPPNFNPSRPLIPGHPPAHHLPLDPIRYLTLAIDSVAPLLRIRSERGAAGGGAALQIPVPLRIRQRRRQAVMWILDSVNKRTNRSSGRGTFALRFADEIISIVEGRSSAWEKRLIVHKLGTTARSNINFRRRR